MQKQSHVMIWGIGKGKVYFSIVIFFPIDCEGNYRFTKSWSLLELFCCN